MLTGRSGRPASPSIAVTQASEDDGPPSTLIRFREAVGVPCRIYGPVLIENRKPRYQLYVSRYADVVLLRDRLWPYLSDPKRQAFLRSFEAHREVRENRRPRSVPRTLCKYGHPLVEGNLYYWTKPDGSRGRSCRTCQLERARQQKLRKRAAKLES